MDVALIHQYRILLALLAAGLVLSFALGLVLGRAPAAPPGPAADAGTRHRVLPHVMLLLVALAAATATILMLPTAMIFRFLDKPPVLIAVLGCLVVIGAPLLYAWRTRPFS